MAYIITGRCMGERYANCVAVCPCGCMHFGEHEGAPMMVIDPDICIDCGACLAECPIGAIVAQPEESPGWAEYNAAAAKIWPNAQENEGDWQPRDAAEPPRVRAPAD